MIHRFQTKVMLLTAVAFFTAAQASYAYFAVVDHSYDPDNNVAGIGRFVETLGGPAVATWDLRTTVANTDFLNAAIQGGADGIQYTMLNAVNNSVDSNIITFRVDPIDRVIPTLTISQSPYTNTNNWNGGNIPGDISQFRMSWDGGSMATIRDSADQLAGLDHNAQVSSGTWVKFTDYQLRNNEDVWSITLPQGASRVTLTWNSSNPTAGSDLTHEWVALDANFAPDPNALPEPGSAPLLVFCLAIGAVSLRRQWR